MRLYWIFIEFWILLWICFIFSKNVHNFFNNFIANYLIFLEMFTCFNIFSVFHKQIVIFFATETFFLNCNKKIHFFYNFQGFYTKLFHFILNIVYFFQHLRYFNNFWNFLKLEFSRKLFYSCWNFFIILWNFSIFWYFSKLL